MILFIYFEHVFLKHKNSVDCIILYDFLVMEKLN